MTEEPPPMTPEEIRNHIAEIYKELAEFNGNVADIGTMTVDNLNAVHKILERLTTAILALDYNVRILNEDLIRRIEATSEISGKSFKKETLDKLLS